jgi:chromosome segregation protein
LENSFYILQHEVNKIEEEHLNNLKNEKNNSNNKSINNELVDKFKHFENRANKRLEFLEEKEKIYDDQIIHLKKEINLHNKNIENLIRHSDMYKKEFEKIENKINEILKDNKNQDEIIKTINDLMEKINFIDNENNKKFEEIKQKIEASKFKNKKEIIANTDADAYVEEKEIDKDSINDILDNKHIKDINKRILDLEKNFKSYCLRVNIDSVKNDIKTINDSISYMNIAFEKEIKTLLENFCK